MSLLRFNINGQVITSEEQLGPIVADTIGYLKAHFLFQSPEWQDLTLYALFKDAKGVIKQKVLLEGGMCDVPHEVIKPKYMKVSVYGLLPNGMLRITTNESIVYISQSGFADDAVMPEQPTPDIYQQINDKMAKQAIDATRAETAQEEAEQAERTAKSHTEQTGEDRIATGEDRVATGADRSAVNTALLGFAETTLPAAIESVENKADSEITRVGQAGDAQVQAVETEGTAQKTSIVSYCEEQQTIINQKVSAANGAKDDAVTAQGQAEAAQQIAETSARTAAQKAAEAAQHDILTQTGLTVEQQITARTNINAAPVDGSYELIETITLTENVASIVRTQEPDGTPYNFCALMVLLDTAASGLGTSAATIRYYLNDTTHLAVYFSSAITAGAKYAYQEAWINRGRWKGEFCQPQDYQSYSPAIYSLPLNTKTYDSVTYPAIRKITVFSNNGAIPIPVGSKITIYGVRA